MLPCVTPVSLYKVRKKMNSLESINNTHRTIIQSTVTLQKENPTNPSFYYVTTSVHNPYYP